MRVASLVYRFVENCEILVIFFVISFVLHTQSWSVDLKHAPWNCLKATYREDSTGRAVRGAVPQRIAIDLLYNAPLHQLRSVETSQELSEEGWSVTKNDLYSALIGVVMQLASPSLHYIKFQKG